MTDQPRQFLVSSFEGKYKAVSVKSYSDSEMRIIPVIEKSAYDSLQAENARLSEALKKIAEIDSAFSSKRNCSYGDWELRLIAREALGPGDAKT